MLNLALTSEYERICAIRLYIFSYKTQHSTSWVTYTETVTRSQDLPIATTGSPISAELVIKSPISAGLSYTQFGKTGIGCVGFFLLCLSRSSLRVTSADCTETSKHKYSSVTYLQLPDLIIVCYKQIMTVWSLNGEIQNLNYHVIA